MKVINQQFGLRIIIALLCVNYLFTPAVSANDPAGSFNSWDSVGPAGGDTRKIVIDPKDKNHLYVSTLDGQIYASYDAGKNWNLLVNFNRPQMIVDQLMIDSRDSNIIYASGHRHKEAGGFFKSTDGGKTWKEAKDLKEEAIHAMVQSPSNPDLLFAGSVTGVWESTDSGDNWKKIQSNTSPVNIDSLAVDPRSPETVYAGTWWRAFKTTDGGKNWKTISNGMIDDSDVFAVDIDMNNPDNVFASACSGIYYSTNLGEKWTKVQGIPSTSRRTRDILQHPSIPGTVFAGTTEGLWVTRDNGKTWALKTSRLLEVNSIAVAPEDPQTVYIATNNYGVMVSKDGGNTFVQNNGNLSTRLTYSIVSDIERPNRMYATTINTATGGGFIFVSDDGGNNWKPSVGKIDVLSLMPLSIIQDRKNTNILYLATHAGIFRSIDRGASWTQVTTPKAVVPARRAAARRQVKGKTAAAPAPAPVSAPGILKIGALREKINTLAYLEDGKNGMIAATNSGLFRTYDINAGWEKLPVGKEINQKFITVSTSASDPNLIWAGTENSGVIVSKDGGMTWKQIADVPKDIAINIILVNPKNPDYVYIGTKRTFFMSKDGGETWTRRGGNLPSGDFAGILVNPNNPNEVFVANKLDINGGIYQSNNAGDTWQRIDPRDQNIASRRFWSLVFDPKNPNRLLAGTHSGGILSIERNVAVGQRASEN